MTNYGHALLLPLVQKGGDDTTWEYIYTAPFTLGGRVFPASRFARSGSASKGTKSRWTLERSAKVDYPIEHGRFIRSSVGASTALKTAVKDFTNPLCFGPSLEAMLAREWVAGGEPLLIHISESEMEYIANWKIPPSLMSRADTVRAIEDKKEPGYRLQWQTQTLHSTLDDILDADESIALEQFKDIHHTLPTLLALLYGSVLSASVRQELDYQVAEGGSIEDTTVIPIPEETPAPVIAEYTRPNGEIYYSRDWSGIPDVEVLRRAREFGKFPFLYGPPGTGKTALSEAAIPDLITVVCSADTTERDLVGQWVSNPKFGEAKEPEYVWVDGPLIIAAEQGRAILLDEVALAEAKVLSVIYPLMDGRGWIDVTANPMRGIVKAAPGFFVIGATNPKVKGADMSEALLSRYAIHVEMTTDWSLATSKLGVPEKIAGVAHSLSRLYRDNKIDWAPQMRELINFRDIAQSFGEEFALNNLVALAPEEERATVTATLARVYGENVVAARI